METSTGTSLSPSEEHRFYESVREYFRSCESPDDLESIMADIDSMGFEEVRSMAKRLGVRTHRRKANTWRGMQELAADCRKKLSELDQLALASIMEKKKLARKMPRNGQASSSVEAHSA